MEEAHCDSGDGAGGGKNRRGTLAQHCYNRWELREMAVAFEVSDCYLSPQNQGSKKTERLYNYSDIFTVIARLFLAYKG